MPTIYEWMQKKTAFIIQPVISQLSKTVQLSGRVMSSVMQSRATRVTSQAASTAAKKIAPYLPETVRHSLVSTHGAVNRLLNPTRLANAWQRSPDTKEVLSWSAYINFVLYALPFFTIRETIDYFYPSEDASEEYWQVFNAVLILTVWLGCYRKIHMIVDNIALSKALIAVVDRENPNNDKVLPPAEANIIANTKTDLISILEYGVGKVSSQVVYTVPRGVAYFFPSINTFYTDMLSAWLNIQAEGYGFFDYTLSRLNMNRKEREEKVSSNQLYLIVCGLLFTTLLYRTTALFDLPATEREDAFNYYFYQNFFYPLETGFITGAFYNFFYQCFIALTYLMDEPLQNEKSLINLYAPTQTLTNYFIQKSSKKIAERFRQENNSNPIETIRKVKKIGESLIARAMVMLLVPKNFLSIPAIVRIPSFQLLLNEMMPVAKINRVSPKLEQVKHNLLLIILNWLPLNWPRVRKLLMWMHKKNVVLAKDAVDIIMSDEVTPLLAALTRLLQEQKKYRQELQEQECKAKIASQENNDLVLSRTIAKQLEKANTSLQTDKLAKHEKLVNALLEEWTELSNILEAEGLIDHSKQKLIADDWVHLVPDLLEGNQLDIGDWVELDPALLDLKEKQNSATKTSKTDPLLQNWMTLNGAEKHLEKNSLFPAAHETEKKIRMDTSLQATKKKFK